MLELADLQVRFRLSPSMAKIVMLLLENKRITGGAIENDHKIVVDAKVIMHRIRRRLEGSGITIQSRRDVGYWMDDDAKATLYEALGVKAPAGQAGDEQSNSEVHSEADHTL